MTDGRTPEQIYDLLVAGAGNADVVRLAAVVRDGVAGGADVFTRGDLVDWWSVRWRGHITSPRRPEQRVYRSLPTLTGSGAVTGDTPDMSVLRADMVGLLAGLVYMAEEQNHTNPNTTSIPVAQATLDACHVLVYGPPEEEPDPPADPPS